MASIIAHTSLSTPSTGFPLTVAFLRPVWSLLSEAGTSSQCRTIIPARPDLSTDQAPSLRLSPSLRSHPSLLGSAWSSLIIPISSLLELFPPILLAVPKHKVSHSRKSMRSANKGLKNKTNFSNCEACGMVKLAHNICPNCYSQISRRWKQDVREGVSGSRLAPSSSSDGPSL